MVKLFLFLWGVGFGKINVIFWGNDIVKFVLGRGCIIE